MEKTVTTPDAEIKVRLACFVESEDGKKKLCLASVKAFETSQCVLNDARVTDEQLRMRITL